MNDKKYYITITPDIDYLFTYQDGSCFDSFGDEIFNEDFSLGPRFCIVVPGIEEWHRRFIKATDFAETETCQSFDWISWHLEGLLFAKEIKRQLPSCFRLYYNPPYEDNSNIIENEIEITEDVDSLIESLKGDANVSIDLAFKHNVSYQTEKLTDRITVTAKVGNSTFDFYIPQNRISDLKQWLLNIIKGEDDVNVLNLPSANLTFFHQRVGKHPEMGQLWIEKKEETSIPAFAAYVNTKEFIKGLYLSLMSELGFFIYSNKVYKDQDYPTGKEREECWKPYNDLKSVQIESYIYDITAKIDNAAPLVTESYVIFPDYGDCIFWDTMGIGCGDYVDLETDSGMIKLRVPGLREWYEEYFQPKSKEQFAEFWKKGWNFALKLRKLFPAHIDLFYMCYDPSNPDAVLDYNCKLTKVIVPHTREIYYYFPTLEANCQEEWENKSTLAAVVYVFDRAYSLTSIEGGVACAKNSFLKGVEKAKEAQQSDVSILESNITVNFDNAEVCSALRKIAEDAFQAGFHWQFEYGQHMFMDSHATLMLEYQDNVMIKNAHPENQWNNRPGNGPTPGFNGKYKFYFKENLTTIKNGDRVALHPHENKGWERSCLFRVVEISDSYIVVDTGWAILNKCDLWDIELIEVSR